MEVKRVDSQGRVALPSGWRREALGDGNEVVIVREGDSITIRARGKADLTRLFDSLEVEVPPESFLEWNTLKKALLEERG